MKSFVYRLVLTLILAATGSSSAQLVAEQGTTITNSYFTLTLPMGFRPLATQTNAGSAEYYFGRQHEGEKSAAVFVVTVKEQKEGNQTSSFLDAKLTAFLSGYCLSMQGTFDSYSKKSTEDVEIGGILFRRIEWEAVKMSQNLNGSLLAAHVNGRRYLVRIQDLEPYAEKGVPIMIDAVKKLKFPKEQ